MIRRCCKVSPEEKKGELEVITRNVFDSQTALTRTTISHCLQLRQFTKDLIDHPEGTVFKGEDFYGNKYYEAPREDNGKYLKTRRWMEPAQASDVSDEEFDKLRKRFV